MNEQPQFQLLMIAHGAIVPSQTQPRTHFDAGKMAELKASLEAHGFTPALSHLLVRPFEYRSAPAKIAGNGMIFEVRPHEAAPWVPVRKRFGIPMPGTMGAPSWAWLNSAADIEAALLELPKYEVICGERRWRVSGELIAEARSAKEEGRIKKEEWVAGMVPVVIEPMSDARALELQLIENLQRDGLSPMEEAEGIARLLELRDPASKEPIYTRETLAVKIGYTVVHVGRQLRIAQLRGTTIGDALEAGKLTAKHARILAAVPAGGVRDALTKRVLAPGGPMPTRQLESVIRDEVMKELRGAAFDQADPELVPVMFAEFTNPPKLERVMGGACTDCPFNSKNTEAGAAERFAMCMNPECFRLKTARAHELWMASVAAGGGTAMSMEEAERVFDFSGRKVAFNSGYVDLDMAPDETELKRKGTQAPTWGKMVKDQGCIVYLAKDAAGRVHDLVLRSAAKSAAHLNGHLIFKDSAQQEQLDHEPSATAALPPRDEAAEKADALTRKDMRDEEDAREAAARIEEEKEMAALVAIAEGKVRAGMLQLPKDFWSALAAATVDAAIALEVFEAVRCRRGWDDSAIEQKLRELTLGELLGLAVECLAAVSDARDVWAGVFGVEPKTQGRRKKDELRSGKAVAV